jgi:hypothetical protein
MSVRERENGEEDARELRVSEMKGSHREIVRCLSSFGGRKNRKEGDG